MRPEVPRVDRRPNRRSEHQSAILPTRPGNKPLLNLVNAMGAERRDSERRKDERAPTLLRLRNPGD